MNSNPQSDVSSSAKKIRKPYTITKSRESWTDEEHDKFLEALQLFDRDWKKIEDFVGSKTVIQIRSHAQKYFQKVQKNGSLAHIPPPRPKRKAAHPYPQKASKNVLVPLQTSIAYPSSLNMIVPPGYSGKLETPQDDFANIQGTEAEARNNYSNHSSGGTNSISEIPNHGNQASVAHGTPDFAEVYSFIGSIFDPGTQGHVQKLKEMDPINFETVLLLMRNLTLNLCNPDFEPIKSALSSSHEAAAKPVDDLPV